MFAYGLEQTATALGAAFGQPLHATHMASLTAEQQEQQAAMQPVAHHLVTRGFQRLLDRIQPDASLDTTLANECITTIVGNYSRDKRAFLSSASHFVIMQVRAARRHVLAVSVLAVSVLTPCCCWLTLLRRRPTSCG